MRHDEGMGRPKSSKNGVRQQLPRSCETCGKAFSVEPHRAAARFCSRPCQHRGHAVELTKPSHRTCERCGQAFTTRPSAPKRFCSQSCASRTHGDAVRGHRVARETFTCVVCGTEFQARRAEGKQCCSRTCASRSFERRIPFRCQICGVEKLVRAKLHDQKYCSRACRTVGIGKTESYLERMMAAALKERGVAAEQSFPIGSYTLDFAIPNRRVAIECDGKYWHSLQECAARDRRKDKFLTGRGWQVLRFPEDRLNSDLAGCLAQIEQALSRETPPPPSSPE